MPRDRHVVDARRRGSADGKEKEERKRFEHCGEIAISMADPPHLVKYAPAVIRVRLFAGLREQAGWSERELDAATVADVWPALGLGAEPTGLLYAVNREYAERGQELRDGDEVALIPPVSGGAFRVTEEPLSLDAVVAEVADERAGAVATFTGTVRRESRGREVTRLEYEAYAEMAEDVMARLAAELLERYELCGIAIHHRVGTLGIGEASVVIAVSAPHRQDALAACRDAIDRLKETVPLWKKEVYEGGEEWIGRGS
jgi:molybdopterin synthase catalytic subunit